MQTLIGMMKIVENVRHLIVVIAIRIRVLVVWRFRATARIGGWSMFGTRCHTMSCWCSIYLRHVHVSMTTFLRGLVARWRCGRRCVCKRELLQQLKIWTEKKEENIRNQFKCFRGRSKTSNRPNTSLLSSISRFIKFTFTQHFFVRLSNCAIIRFDDVKL